MDMFRFFNEFRNETFFIPLVTQRSYAWDEERMDLFLELVHEHAISETEYYFTTISVRGLGNGFVKIGDGGNRVVTYMVSTAALVNFIHDNYDKLNELYGEDMTNIEYHIKSLNDMILWKNIGKQIPRILLEDDFDMNSLLYCLTNNSKIHKIKKSGLINNYKVAYAFYEKLFLDENNELTLSYFIEKGLNKVTTILEECETEEEETELFFLKNANIGIQLKNIEILGNSFNGYMRKYGTSEEEIKELQNETKELFVKLKKLFETKGLFPKTYKKSFFSLFCYYLGVNSGKTKLIPNKEVSRKLDNFVKDVLNKKKVCPLFNSPKSLLNTFSYFIDFSINMVKKNFPEFKYCEMLKDIPLNGAYFILAIDLLTNKFNSLSDEEKSLCFKYGKKIFILHNYRKASAHPENVFCDVIRKIINNSKENETEIKTEIMEMFKKLKKTILDNDISPEKIRSFIEYEAFYKRGQMKNLILDEINEVLDSESHLRPFNIARDSLTIEHICPQSLYDGHPNLDKLGNLCILSKKTNSSFSNRANWKDRHDTYVRCPWAINRTINQFTDKFTLDEEFQKRHNFLCDAFVVAMTIGDEYEEKCITLKPVLVD